MVLDALIAARPEMEGEVELVATELLSTVSIEQVTSEVETALVSIPLDALASRAGRVRGRGYVHETDAAWETVDETIEPFRSDLERRAALGLTDAATTLAIGIVAGLYRVREPEMGTVLAYAGEDAPCELAAAVMDVAAKVGTGIPDDAAETHWPTWDHPR